MINARHGLVKLAALIDWDFFEREWAILVPSHRGRSATSPHLAAGLMYFQHAFTFSDEAVVARWVEIRITSTSPARRSSSTARRSIPRRWCAGTSGSAKKCRMASDQDDRGRPSRGRGQRQEPEAGRGRHGGHGKDHRPSDGRAALRAGTRPAGRVGEGGRYRPAPKLRAAGSAISHPVGRYAHGQGIRSC